MPAGPRARLIASTITTVSDHGVHATTLDELLQRGNASPDFLHHHFPLGRDELVTTAARSVSRMVYSHMCRMADALATMTSVEDWLDRLFAVWRGPWESTPATPETQRRQSYSVAPDSVRTAAETESRNRAIE
ncbi:TetR/AcrR family transcriptional regulator [Nocardia acidivorans]|uniref:TetR/AcrR family transcriptional regulator n=1 Tax=Nocardia acidivorans TaxID=404580 RepID=UPI0012FCE13B|nr:TetR family transcriptional regulator [Nocardia acidivorans]